jgi:hypothetical protein
MRFESTKSVRNVLNLVCVLQQRSASNTTVKGRQSNKPNPSETGSTWCVTPKIGEQHNRQRQAIKQTKSVRNGLHLVCVCVCVWIASARKDDGLYLHDLSCLFAVDQATLCTNDTTVLR